jgi:hypothetical protein
VTGGKSRIGLNISETSVSKTRVFGATCAVRNQFKLGNAAG